MWKDIPGFEGSYQVSDSGQVRSLKKGKWGNQRAVPRILKPADRDGYPRVGLSDGRGKIRSFCVHRLVAEGFLERGSKEQATVNHKNGNKHDNRVENLEWSSHREHSLHKHRVLRRGACPGEKNRSAAITDNQVVEARRAYYTGEKSGPVIAKELGLSKAHTYKMLAGGAWSHLPVPELTRAKNAFRVSGQRDRRSRERYQG